jgi:hypothetical protein
MLNLFYTNRFSSFTSMYNGFFNSAVPSTTVLILDGQNPFLKHTTWFNILTKHLPIMLSTFHIFNYFHNYKYPSIYKSLALYHHLEIITWYSVLPCANHINTSIKCLINITHTFWLLHLNKEYKQTPNQFRSFRTTSTWYID